MMEVTCKPIVWSPPEPEPTVTSTGEIRHPPQPTLTDARGFRTLPGEVGLLAVPDLERYEGCYEPAEWDGPEHQHGYRGELGPVFKVEPWPSAPKKRRKSTKRTASAESDTSE